MNDHDAQAAFHRRMEEAPEDDQVRLVYADWLQDRGHDAQAEWLRWGVGLKNHLDAHEGRDDFDVHYASTDGGHPAVSDQRASRLIQIHRVRQALKRVPVAEGNPPGAYRHALGVAERVALGLALPAEVGNATTRLASSGIPAGHHIHQALHELLASITRQAFISPARRAQWHEEDNGPENPGRGSGGPYPATMPMGRAVRHNSVGAEYTRDNPPPTANSKPVHLAAIEAPNRTGGSVLVRVPTPVPTAPQAPQATGPATPLPNDGPAPKQPKNSGPAFILPV